MNLITIRERERDQTNRRLDFGFGPNQDIFRYELAAFYSALLGGRKKTQKDTVRDGTLQASMSLFTVSSVCKKVEALRPQRLYVEGVAVARAQTHGHERR